MNTREVKVIGTLYIADKSYNLVRQEAMQGFSSDVTGWTIVTNVGGKLIDGVWLPVLGFVTTTLGWLIEYHETTMTIADDVTQEVKPDEDASMIFGELTEDDWKRTFANENTYKENVE